MPVQGIMEITNRIWTPISIILAASLNPGSSQRHILKTKFMEGMHRFLLIIISQLTTTTATIIPRAILLLTVTVGKLQLTHSDSHLDFQIYSRVWQPWNLASTITTARINSKRMMT
jgi:hypothetical protein